MKNLKVDENVMMADGSLRLIDHENGIVELDAGVLWVYLLDSDERVGIAFSGSSRFVVDAIAETPEGAIGRSISGTLSGVQIFIGGSEIEDVSLPATTSALEKVGFTTSVSFREAVEDRLSNLTYKDRQYKISNVEGAALLGQDNKEKEVILVESKKGLVFVYGKHVFVMADDNFVSVGTDGVVLGEHSGRPLIITKDGISGLDLDFGDIIGKSVGTAMAGVARGMKGLKGMKAMRRDFRQFQHGPYENVDDFDWADDE